MLRVGHNPAGAQEINELAADGRPHDEQFLTAVVEHQMDPLPRRQLMFLGEGLVDDHFVLAPPGEIATAAEEDVVDGRIPPLGQRQHQAVDGLYGPGQIDGRIEADPRANGRHAGQTADLVDLGQWRFFQLDGKIGHAALAVVVGLGRLQAAIDRGHAHIAAHAQCDYEADGEQEPERSPKLAAKFSVQYAHQTISSGGTGRVLHFTSTT